MTTDRGALAALLATMAALASATPAIAQTEQTAPVRGLEGLANPQAPSSQTGTAIPIPDAPKIVLPKDGSALRRAARPRTDQRPTDQRPADKRVTDRPAAERTTSRAEPETRQADAPVRSSQDTNAPTASAPTSAPIVQQPAPTQIPANDGAPQAVAPQPAAPTAEPVTQPSTVAAPETGRAMPFWLWLLVIVVVVGAVWALRRRKPDAAHARELRKTPVPVAEPIADVEPVAVDEAPRAAPARPVVAKAPVAAVEPPSVPVAVAPAAPKFLEPRGKAVTAPPPVARARLTCELRPLRAGLNLLSATVECEMVVTNTGTAPAEGIRAGIALLTAHADQDVDLAAFNAAPVVRPAAPPFALAAGETRTIRTVTAIAREAIRTMTAANRPMFVPVVATNILYVTAGDEAQTARAWVVGIERVDSAKLAPFWLDAPARMYTTVAARPHAVTFDR